MTEKCKLDHVFAISNTAKEILSQEMGLKGLSCRMLLRKLSAFHNLVVKNSANPFFFISLSSGISSVLKL